MSKLPEQPHNVFMNLNVSNDSNFEADSGYIFQRILWQAINRQRDDLRLFFLGHTSNGSPWHENVTMLPFHDRYDKFSTRFHFDWHRLKELAKDLPHIDTIVNNQPEHTLALKMIFASLYDGEVPTISYYHYLPFHYEGDEITFDPSQHLANFSAPFILGRNLEAMELSDMNLIGSNFGRDILVRAYDERKIKKLKKPVEVFAPPIEREVFELTPADNDGRKRVLYNQRLYKHYGTEAVIGVLKDLAKDIPFKLVITDPTGKRSKERERLDPEVTKYRQVLADLPFVELRHCQTRKDYHQLLRDIDVGIAPFKPSALWSMAVADVLAAGKPVLCPNVGAFPELVPNNPELLFGNIDELRLRLTKLLKGEMTFEAEEMRENVRMHHEDQAAKRYVELINV